MTEETKTNIKWWEYIIISLAVLGGIVAIFKGGIFLINLNWGTQLEEEFQFPPEACIGRDSYSTECRLKELESWQPKIQSDQIYQLQLQVNQIISTLPDKERCRIGKLPIIQMLEHESLYVLDKALGRWHTICDPYLEENKGYKIP